MKSRENLRKYIKILHKLVEIDRTSWLRTYPKLNYKCLLNDGNLQSEMVMFKARTHICTRSIQCSPDNNSNIYMYYV